MEPRRVLDEIDSDEKAVPGGEDGGRGAEEGRHVVRVQVAEGAGEEEQQPPAARPEGRQVVQEVPDDARAPRASG